MKKTVLSFIFSLFLIHFSYGQKYIPFDTSDVSEIETLVAYYDLHYDKIISNINLDEKKERKGVVDTYKKQKEYFLDKIVTQSFILDSAINKYLNNLFKETLNANGLELDKYRMIKMLTNLI